MFSAKDLFFTPPAGGYRISNSLRFRSSASAYLNRTPGSASNQTTWTWSGWVKRGTLGARQGVFVTANAAGNDYVGLEFLANDKLAFIANNGSGADQLRLETNAVFRDPSAWYHIVVVFNTTNATSTNRAAIYINGVAQTYSTTTYMPQNYSGRVNTAVQHNLGSWLPASGLYFDGYMAEVNFIDGQALTPSSFGETDAATGVWQPKAYTGIYGTNGFYLPFTPNTTSTYAGNFSGSAQFLSLANNSAFYLPGATNWTIEMWINSSSATLQRLFSYTNSSVSVGADISYGAYFTPGGLIALFQYTGTVQTFLSATVNAPTGQWFHLAFVNNAGTITIYVNGVASGTAAAASTPNNSGTYQFYIGNYNNSGYINGQISNFRIVKGTAVYTANFTPSTSNLTAITNTSLLTLQNNTIVDNSSNGFTITNTGSLTTVSATPFVANITADASGQNNGWIPANINATSSGVTYDSMIDTPTNFDNGGNGAGNYCVLNPLDQGNSTANTSNGNLTASGGSANAQLIYGGMGVSSGKWYWETTITAVGGESSLGISAVTEVSNTTTNYVVGSLSTGYGYYFTGGKYNNASLTSYGSSYTTGDVIGVAFDADTGSLTFYKNNASQGVAFSSIPAGAYKPAFECRVASGTSIQNVNFGQRPFVYAPPSGFKALNTQNLTTPTIINGAQYMDATLYSGNGSSRTITGELFSPDFVWIKSRSAATDHALYDTVRGVQLQLESNTTTAETTESTGLTAFTADGFTVGSLAQVNTNAATYVAWLWDAASANTTIPVNAYGSTPSIASTVRANTTAGFSIVTYTGTGANATVGHGLGVAPKMVIVKNRSAGGAGYWLTWHAGMTSAGYYLALNLTLAQTADGTIWNSTAPTSSVFSIGTNTTSNNSGTTFVAYCFAEVAGYSAFGRYTGNGSADGPFVYLGFRPRYVMVKRTDSTGNWFVWDSARDTFNTVVRELYPDSSSAEVTRTGSNDSLDFVSNGFKIRFSSTFADRNASGGTYIYAAFAENPFKISRAR